MQKSKLAVIALIALFAVLIDSFAVMAQGPRPFGPTAGVGTGFTYQGRLLTNSAPVNDACNLTFSLWDSQSNPGGQVGGSQTLNAVSVANGQFTVVLNGAAEFGPNAFAGQER